MNKKDIIDAYLKIRSIDNTIPDEVIEFMKNAAINALPEFQQPQPGIDLLNEVEFYDLMQGYHVADMTNHRDLIERLEKVKTWIRRNYTPVRKKMSKRPEVFIGGIGYDLTDDGLSVYYYNRPHYIFTDIEGRRYVIHGLDHIYLDADQLTCQQDKKGTEK